MPFSRTTATKTVTAPKGFIKLTRLYTQGATIKSAPVILARTGVESFRARTASKGKKLTGMKSSVVTSTGKYINVKETVAEIAALLNESNARL